VSVSFKLFIDFLLQNLEHLIATTKVDNPAFRTVTYHNDEDLRHNGTHDSGDCILKK